MATSSAGLGRAGRATEATAGVPDGRSGGPGRNSSLAPSMDAKTMSLTGPMRLQRERATLPVTLEVPFATRDGSVIQVGKKVSGADDGTPTRPAETEAPQGVCPWDWRGSNTYSPLNVRGRDNYCLRFEEEEV